MKIHINDRLFIELNKMWQKVKLLILRNSLLQRRQKASVCEQLLIDYIVILQIGFQATTVIIQALFK